MTRRITLSGEDFEQDIRPLIQAFFPKDAFEVKNDNWKEGCSLCEGFYAELKEQSFSLLIILDGVRLESSEEAIYHGGSALTGKALTRDIHKEYRNQLLRAIYRLLHKATGRKLPWGILTGVRPTKLLLEGLEAGMPDAAVLSNMKERYYCSDEKAELALEVAGREQGLLKQVDLENTYSLYVGIPFCPSICNYCSFSSFPLEKYGCYVDAYVEALKKEIEGNASLLGDKGLATVYFGGGTPTSLHCEQLRAIIRTVRENFNTEGVLEFTVEAGRPDTITMEKLQMLKEEGTTRISINPQTMNQHTLDLIGRRHSVEMTEDAFHMAREAGHDNINMDLIIGLTGENAEDVGKTLERVGRLMPDSLTVHTLARKRAARLTTEKARYEGLEASGIKEMFLRTTEFARDNNYLPYYLYRQKYMEENLENIGYSRPGKEGLYNVLIMEEKQVILALGAGASSKFVFQGENRFERVENVKNVPDYIARIDEMIARKKDFLKKQRWTK